MSAPVCENVLTKWSSILNKYTPKRQRIPRRIVSSIILDILAVDTGIKPAFLLDCWSYTTAEMLSILKELKETGLCRHGLQVLVFDPSEENVSSDTFKQDVFIFNNDTIVDWLNAVLYCKTLKIVDVSTAVGQPTVKMDISDITKQAREIMTHIQSSKECDLVKIPTSPEWNLTTLTGALLGYPYSYWFTPPTPEADNCLNFTPLVNYKLRCKVNSCFQGNGEKDTVYHTVYSFSIPSCIDSKWDVDMWAKTMEDRLQKQKLFLDSSLSQEERTLPSVML